MPLKNDIITNILELDALLDFVLKRNAKIYAVYIWCGSCEKCHFYNYDIHNNIPCKFVTYLMW